MDIYFALERFRDHIAHIARVPTGARGDKYIATGLNSAELIKVSSNAFLALKISFANSIAILADKAGADVVEVMDAVGADNRIGRAFLNAGRGYGGGCFPKDVSGLISSGLAQNQLMPGYVVDKLQDAVGQLTGKRIAVLGLAFKAGTSDVRKSPGVAIANKLKEAGADVISYDPQANEEAASDLHDDVKQVETIDEAIKGADAAVIATEWSEILKYPAESFAQHLKTKVLLDAVNQYNAIDATTAGLTYLGVGHSV